MEALPWARSHAALPVPVHAGGDRLRIFYSSREQREPLACRLGRRRSLGGTPRVIASARATVLAPGADGSFDDSGVGIGLDPAGDGLALYYMGGIRRPLRVAQRDRPGAVAHAGRTVRARLSGPDPHRSPEDPYTLSYPCVLQLGAQDWRMWYGSDLAPGTGKSDMQHAIKMARSADGINWSRDGATAIGFADANEYALARPSVIRLGGKLLMCFACRGEAYRIGAATSEDGVSWTRRDREYGLIARLSAGTAR